MREEQVKEFAYSEYGRYLLVNPTIDKSVDYFVNKILIADIHIPVEQILETFTNNRNNEGILITNSMKYVGFLSAYSLLGILNEKNLAIARDQNPLTKMPGNNLIYEYVSKALQDSENMHCFIYFDKDNFKAYNDKYGFRQGDRIIMLFSDLLENHVNQADRFGGHVGGDDFFMGIKRVTAKDIVAEVREMSEKFEMMPKVFMTQTQSAQDLFKRKTATEGNAFHCFMYGGPLI